MSHYELVTFASVEALARGVAQRWLDELAAAPQGQAYCVALSGGRVARNFFGAVADLGRAPPQLFANVHFFWADERCVPPDDAESNFWLAQKSLFLPLAIPPERIHRICGEAEPAEAATSATRELRRLAPADAAGNPVLDLVFLGMGEDGHIASLFPNAPEFVSESPAVYYPVTGPKPPPRRITMSFAALSAAKKAWVIISGQGKKQAFSASLAKEGRTPLAQLLQQRTATIIFVDNIGI
jgi:6-phosphogluconolactonase